MQHPILPALLLLLAPLTQAQVPAPEGGLSPRWLPEKSLDFSLLASRGSILPGDPGDPSAPPTVVLKLRDDLGARTIGGRLFPSPDGPALNRVRRVLADVVGTRVDPLFSVSSASLRAMREQGEMLSREQLADLSQYFLVRLPEGTEPVRVLAALLALDDVENAYLSPLPAPPPGDYLPTTPSFITSQSYRSAAPSGIDAIYAATQPGGMGAGLTVADVEYSWNLAGLFGSTLGHEDLQTASGWAPAIGNTSSWSDPFNDTNHGTAVAGILNADTDPAGITGLAGGARLRVSAANFTGGFSPAQGILNALKGLHQGGVLLVEMQNFGPNWPGSGQFGMVPVEYYDAEYNAIRQATALGVHVVEAAGNGSQDLDSTTPPSGDPSFPGKFTLALRDSVANVVGAGSSSTPHTPMGFTNRGSRVDVFAWGENVVTLGYGDLFNGNPMSPDVDQYYTSWFGGTSSASAMVAAAVTSLAGSHWTRNGGPWVPKAMRLFLRTTGTPTTNPTSDRIGRQPDLRDEMQIVAMGPQPALVFTGEMAGDFAGKSVAGAGDVDNDGVDDVIVGAYLNSAGGGNAGRAYVVSGRTGARLRTFTGSGVGDQFGFSVGGAGDLDNDGWDDVIVGARWNTAGGANAGRVYVFSGRTGGTLRTFTGATGDELGYSVDGVGDVDNDGFDDVVAGALGANAGVGRAYVYSGQTGSVIWTLNGTATLGHFGYSVAGAGDVNNDGTPDVIVGAPHTGGSGGPGGLQIGAAYAYSGATGGPIRSWQGTANFAHFGAAVDGAGDVDGDGWDDVIVGSPLYDPGSTDAGRADVLSGMTGSTIQTWTGQATNDRFGESVAGAGDWDGDGLADVIVGAPGHDSAGNDAGRAYVFTGVMLGTATTIYDGQAASDLFGSSVGCAGDLDGDGRDDLIVGAQWNGAGGAQAGRAYTFVGPPPEPWYLGLLH